MIASLLADLSQPDRRGYILGLSGSLDKATGIFSPLLGGILFDQVAPAAPAALAGCLTAVACALAAIGLPSSAAGQQSSASGPKGKRD